MAAGGRVIGYIKAGLAAFTILVLVVVVGAYLLPATVSFSRSIVIAAPPEKIFALVGDLHAANAWSPWATLDPALQVTYSGPAQGLGSRVDWASANPAVGKGSQTITAYDPPRFLSTALDFGTMGKSTSFWVLSSDGQGTRLVWGFEAQLNTVLDRWAGLMLEQTIAPDYERGLVKLKFLAETPAAKN